MTPAHTDLELLRQLRAGTAAAFQTLYQRHQGPLFRFALLRCGSGDTAADIVQEVFMGLLTNSIKFDPVRGALPNFLFGVARNLLLKHEAPRLRTASLDEEHDQHNQHDQHDQHNQHNQHDEDTLPADAHAEPLARLLSNEAAEQVRRALALLAPHYRDVLILYEMHDLSYQEIADICRIDLGTVRSRLSRGRAALARRLAATQEATS